jgi:hypothetical protein
MALAAVALDPEPQPVVVNLTPAVLTFEAVPLTVVPLVLPKTSGMDPVDKSSYATASVTIGGADKVALVAVLTINASSPNTPSLSGPSGVDWAVVRDFFFDQVSTFRRLTVFAGTAASETTGVITIDYAGQNQATVLWSVVEASEVDTTTDKGVVQSAQNQVSGTVLTVTLPDAIGDPVNLDVGVFVNGSNTTFEPGSGFLELHDLNASPEAADGTLLTEWKFAGADITVDATAAITDPDLAGIALELLSTLAAAGAGSVDLTPAALALTAVALDPEPQPVVVNLTPATLTFEAVPLSVAGAGSVDLTPATLALTAVALDPEPQPVVVNLTPATLTFEAVALDPEPQPVVVNLTPAALTLTAVVLDPTTGDAVSLTPAALTLTAMPLDPVPQPVTVALEPAALSLLAVALDPAPQPVSVALTPAALILEAIAFTAGGAGTIGDGADIPLIEPSPEVTMTEPSAEETVTEPPGAAEVTEPSGVAVMTDPSAEETVTEPAGAVSVSEPSGRVVLIEPSPLIIIQETE